MCGEVSDRHMHGISEGMWKHACICGVKKSEKEDGCPDWPTSSSNPSVLDPYNAGTTGLYQAWIVHRC